MNDNNDLTHIFFKACDMEGDERAAYLDQACGDNSDLRDQVERLLEAGDSLANEDKTHIADQLLQGAAKNFVEATEEAPSSIGPFSILGEIGAGGMSVVYEAEQHEPVKRHVALKVIRPGMDTRDVISRFEAERQALAVMDHVNIAKIFDGGATESGRPYFVMELVSGEPVTDYCDKHRLSIRARLRLFMTICTAVQHAHQKGVVHRDLKPSNILVSEQDNEPLVKVIDFGIAKALDVSLNDDPTETRYGQVMGTPTHMSPEQAAGNIDAIDTRTDVFSLGVVLYQLLTGYMPYEVNGLSGEMIRQSIESAATTRPSAKFKTFTEDTEQLAALRKTSAVNLRSQLASDLDWIVMRAMEIEPERRYQTANAFAKDITNYLNARPIEARPPTTGYLVSRFVRRNRKTVAAVSAIALALIGGVAMATIGLIRATEAEKEARFEQRTAEKAKDFLVSTFKVIDPDTSLGEKISARDLLNAGAARIEEELEGEPRIQGELLMTMGRAYENLALYKEAEPMLRQAVERSIEAYGEQHPKVAAGYQELGEILWRIGQYDDAKQAQQKALNIIANEFGRSHPDYAVNLSKLGMAYIHDGDYDRARELFEDSQQLFTELELQNSHDSALNLNNLGGLHLRLGQFAEAEPFFLEAQTIWQRLYGDVHPDLALVISNFGAVYAKLGDYDKAAEYHQDALDMRRRLYDGQLHSEIAVSLNNLATLYWRQQNYDEAEPLYRESLDMRRSIFGDMSPSVATGLNNLAGVLREQGKLETAENTYRESIMVRQVLQGEDHPNVAVTRTNLAAVLNLQKKYDEGLRQASAALISLQTSLGPIHWRVSTATSVKGAAMAGLGRYLDAEALLIKSFDDIRQSRGDTDLYTRQALDRVITLYRDWERHDQVERYTQLRDSLFAL